MNDTFKQVCIAVGEQSMGRIWSPDRHGLPWRPARHKGEIQAAVDFLVDIVSLLNENQVQAKSNGSM